MNSNNQQDYEQGMTKTQTIVRTVSEENYASGNPSYLKIHCKPIRTTPGSQHDDESCSLSEESNSDCLSADSVTSIGHFATCDSFFHISFSREQERDWEEMAERRRRAAQKQKGRKSMKQIFACRKMKLKERITQIHPKAIKAKAQERIEDYVDMVSDLLQYRLSFLPAQNAVREN